MLSHKFEPTPELVKQTFRCAVSLLKHTNKSIRGAALGVYVCAYAWVSEPFEELKKVYLKNLKPMQVKELETLCLQKGKRSGTRVAFE